MALVIASLNFDRVMGWRYLGGRHVGRIFSLDSEEGLLWDPNFQNETLAMSNSSSSELL